MRAKAVRTFYVIQTHKLISMRRKSKLPTSSEKALLLSMMYYLDANYHEMVQRNKEAVKQANIKASRQAIAEKEHKLQACREELATLNLEIEKEREGIRKLQKETQLEVQRYTVDMQQLLHAVVDAKDTAQTPSKYSPNQNVIYAATFVNQCIPEEQTVRSYADLIVALEKARVAMGEPSSHIEAD